MEVHLAEAHANTARGKRAEEILRSCVHCGFCNATCPTYQLLGDELDGPRGRIYLIKQVLEEDVVDAVIGPHLDRCLTCRACETTCPSGVAYGELLEIGREIVEPEYRRSIAQKLIRKWMLSVVPNAQRMKVWLRLGSLVRWLLPAKLAAAIPKPGKILKTSFPVDKHKRKVILLGGCVQAAAKPGITQWLTHLLDDIGVEAVMVPGCCGSLALHLSETQQAVQTMRSLIDSLGQVLDELPARSDEGTEQSKPVGDRFAQYKFSKIDAIISTASGCGVTVKDFGRLLKDDSEYAGLAELVASKTVDVSEYLDALNFDFCASESYENIAWQAPCTLQHGQQINGVVEQLLQTAGYNLVGVSNQHLCCGSAGTYSVLEADLSFELRDNKLRALGQNAPQAIVTGNIGCQLHLQSGTKLPVKHWLELLKVAKP